MIVNVEIRKENSLIENRAIEEDARKLSLVANCHAQNGHSPLTAWDSSLVAALYVLYTISFNRHTQFRAKLLSYILFRTIFN